MSIPFTVSTSTKSNSPPLSSKTSPLSPPIKKLSECHAKAFDETKVYKQTLTDPKALERLETFRKDTYKIDPKPYSTNGDKKESNLEKLPPIDFTIGELHEFLSERLTKRILPNPPYLIGGAASRVLSGLPYADVDICYNIVTNELPKVTEVVREFIITRLETKGVRRNNNEEWKQLVNDHYFYDKKTIDNTMAIYSLGPKFQLKFIFDAEHRRSTSGSEGFHIYLLNDKPPYAYCVKGNHPCGQKEYEEAETELTCRKFVAYEPSEAKKLFFRLAHKLTQGFEISNPDKVVAIALNKLIEEFPLPAKEKDMDFGEHVLKHLKNHHPDDEKERQISFLNFLYLLQYIENQQNRDLYTKKLIETWKSQYPNQLTSFIALLLEHPNSIENILGWVEGMRFLAACKKHPGTTIFPTFGNNRLPHPHFAIQNGENTSYQIHGQTAIELARRLMDAWGLLLEQFGKNEELFKKVMSDLGLPAIPFSKDQRKETVNDLLEIFNSNDIAAIAETPIDGVIALFESLEKEFSDDPISKKIAHRLKIIRFNRVVEKDETGKKAAHALVQCIKKYLEKESPGIDKSFMQGLAEAAKAEVGPYLVSSACQNALFENISEIFGQITPQSDPQILQQAIEFVLKMQNNNALSQKQLADLSQIILKIDVIKIPFESASALFKLYETLKKWSIKSDDLQKTIAAAHPLLMKRLLTIAEEQQKTQVATDCVALLLSSSECIHYKPSILNVYSQIVGAAITSDRIAQLKQTAKLAKPLFELFGKDSVPLIEPIVLHLLSSNKSLQITIGLELLKFLQLKAPKEAYVHTLLRSIGGLLISDIDTDDLEKNFDLFTTALPYLAKGLHGPIASIKSKLSNCSESAKHFIYCLLPFDLELTQTIFSNTKFVQRLTKNDHTMVAWLIINAQAKKNDCDSLTNACQNWLQVCETFDAKLWTKQMSTTAKLLLGVLNHDSLKENIKPLADYLIKEIKTNYTLAAQLKSEKNFCRTILEISKNMSSTNSYAALGRELLSVAKEYNLIDEKALYDELLNHIKQNLSKRTPLSDEHVESFINRFLLNPQDEDDAAEITKLACSISSHLIKHKPDSVPSLTLAIKFATVLFKSKLMPQQWNADTEAVLLEFFSVISTVNADSCIHAWKEFLRVLKGTYCVFRIAQSKQTEILKKFIQIGWNNEFLEFFDYLRASEWMVKDSDALLAIANEACRNPLLLEWVRKMHILSGNDKIYGVWFSALEKNSKSNVWVLVQQDLESGSFPSKSPENDELCVRVFKYLNMIKQKENNFKNLGKLNTSLDKLFSMASPSHQLLILEELKSSDLPYFIVYANILLSAKEGIDYRAYALILSVLGDFTLINTVRPKIYESFPGICLNETIPIETRVAISKHLLKDLQSISNVRDDNFRGKPFNASELRVLKLIEALMSANEDFAKSDRDTLDLLYAIDKLRLGLPIELFKLLPKIPQKGSNALVCEMMGKLPYDTTSSKIFDECILAWKAIFACQKTAFTEKEKKYFVGCFQPNADCYSSFLISVLREILLPNPIQKVLARECLAIACECYVLQNDFNSIEDIFKVAKKYIEPQLLQDDLNEVLSKCGMSAADTKCDLHEISNFEQAVKNFVKLAPLFEAVDPSIGVDQFRLLHAVMQFYTRGIKVNGPIVSCDQTVPDEVKISAINAYIKAVDALDKHKFHDNVYCPTKHMIFTNLDEYTGDRILYEKLIVETILLYLNHDIKLVETRVNKLAQLIESIGTKEWYVMASQFAGFIPSAITQAFDSGNCNSFNASLQVFFMFFNKILMTAGSDSEAKNEYIPKFHEMFIMSFNSIFYEKIKMDLSENLSLRKSRVESLVALFLTEYAKIPFYKEKPFSQNQLYFLTGIVEKHLSVNEILVHDSFTVAYLKEAAIAYGKLLKSSADEGSKGIFKIMLAVSLQQRTEGVDNFALLEAVFSSEKFIFTDEESQKFASYFIHQNRSSIYRDFLYSVLTKILLPNPVHKRIARQCFLAVFESELQAKDFKSCLSYYKAAKPFIIDAALKNEIKALIVKHVSTPIGSVPESFSKIERYECEVNRYIGIAPLYAEMDPSMGMEAFYQLQDPIHFFPENTRLVAEDRRRSIQVYLKAIDVLDEYKFVDAPTEDKYPNCPRVSKHVGMRIRIEILILNHMFGLMSNKLDVVEDRVNKLLIRLMLLNLDFLDLLIFVDYFTGSLGKTSIQNVFIENCESPDSAFKLHISAIFKGINLILSSSRGATSELIESLHDYQAKLFHNIFDEYYKNLMFGDLKLWQEKVKNLATDYLSEYLNSQFCSNPNIKCCQDRFIKEEVLPQLKSAGITVPNEVLLTLFSITSNPANDQKK